MPRRLLNSAKFLSAKSDSISDTVSGSYSELRKKEGEGTRQATHLIEPQPVLCCYRQVVHLDEHDDPLFKYPAGRQLKAVKSYQTLQEDMGSLGTKHIWGASRH